VGLSDLYFTDKPDVARMHSRPVMGGIFIRMLYDKDIWKKWASRDVTRAAGPWAPIPIPVAVKTTDIIKPASLTWRYTTQKPAGQWTAPDFDDASWQEGPGGFGTRNTPGAIVKTVWNTSDIYLRTEIIIPSP